jgi:nicotinamidase-related amidase
VIEKPLPNSFAKTSLEEALRTAGRDAVLLAGFMTHMCVSSTARAALDLGFPVTIAADATATRDLPDPLGGVVPAETVQRAALAELADRFACVARSEAIPA